MLNRAFAALYFRCCFVLILRMTFSFHHGNILEHTRCSHALTTGTMKFTVAGSWHVVTTSAPWMNRPYTAYLGNVAEIQAFKTSQVWHISRNLAIYAAHVYLCWKGVQLKTKDDIFRGYSLWSQQIIMFQPNNAWVFLPLLNFWLRALQKVHWN